MEVQCLRLCEVQEILQAEVMCGAEFLEREIFTVCGADLMSDVLTFTKEKTLLLTGLTNIQVVRTADISDLVAIVFVRGKKPTAELINMAEERSIPLLTSEFPMYESCGRLFESGLRGCSKDGGSCDE